MNIPAAVRQQSRASAELHASIYGKAVQQPNGAAPTPPETPPEVPSGGPETPPEAPQTPPVTPDAPQTPETPPVPPQGAQQTPDGQPIDWEHRYRTVQGMMSAQQQRHQKEMGELRTLLQNQNTLIQELRTNRQHPAAAPNGANGAAPAPVPRNGRYLKPEEIADYGEDMIDVIHRAAREVMEPEIAQVREQVQVTAVDRMYAALERAVPNYAQLNTDPNFLQWLAQVDPYAGQTRQEMLNTAATNLDATRVIAFFRGYLDQTAAVTPQAPGGNGPTPPQPRQPQVPIQTLVAPGRPQSPTGQSVPQSNGRVWTRPEVAMFYDDIRRGVYANRHDERVRLEQDLIAAAREGRIR